MDKPYMTGFVSGDTVTIYLYEPSGKAGESELRINKLVHAYKSTGMPNKEIPLDCYHNIISYPEWEWFMKYL